MGGIPARDGNWHPLASSRHAWRHGVIATPRDEILQIALDAGVSKIIPHIYSSIIDSATGNTRPDDVKTLLASVKKLVG